MTDHLTPDQRHAVMSSIRGKDTTPETIVRSLIHSAGFRFRLHRQELPGTPDLVFPRLRKVIFVHGCFWHGHKHKSMPKTNTAFWEAKIRANMDRDKQNIKALKKMGWRTLVVWECHTRSKVGRSKLLEKLLTFLND